MRGRKQENEGLVVRRRGRVSKAPPLNFFFFRDSPNNLSRCQGNQVPPLEDSNFATVLGFPRRSLHLILYA